MFDLGDEICNFSKTKFSRKNMILIVCVNAFIWKFDTTKGHYLASSYQIFRILAWFLNDWKHVNWILIFLNHPVKPEYQFCYKMCTGSLSKSFIPNVIRQNRLLNLIITYKYDLFFKSTFLQIFDLDSIINETEM